VIKRYANRKLYDTRASRYVTLQEIAQFVRDGDEVQIIDNKSKEDLTNVTLAQIIYEEQKLTDDTHGWSARSLRHFIQEGRARILSSLREGPMGKLVRWDEEEDGASEREAEPVEEKWTEPPSAERAPDSEGLDEPTRRSAKEAFDELSRLADERVRALAATARGHVHHLQGEVRRLQGRIEELEERLRRVGRRSDRSDAAGEADAEGSTDEGARPRSDPPAPAPVEPRDG
jgi:polyhydroxyalkanoate synthesis repressor PhaR